ncbi:MAG: CDP-alcohol phosphatidyltransferase family protein [Tidjanibacter sp.]|nr:CDP-alcohol phosphatidyltransferase family protein [Tidjanibacter sp.]
MRAHIANIITGSRILGAFVLLLFPLFSAGFYATYLLCGFSDMIDGTVARKTNSTSGFGAKFDTAADLIFVVVVCSKLLPAICLPQWMWLWIALIAAAKLSNIIWGLLRRKSLVSIHSILNKATGVGLFLLPLTVRFVDLKWSVATACLLATCAALHEGYYIIIRGEILLPQRSNPPL